MPDITPDTTKNRLIKLALQRFLTQGYSKVSVDELSSSLHISKKTLYQEFRSKRVLLTESVVWYMDTCRSEVKFIVSQETDFTRKIEQLLNLIHEYFGWLEPYAIEDLQTQAPEVWQYVVDVRRETLTETLIKLFEEGKQEGALDEKLESALVAEMMLASLEALTQPKVLTTQTKNAPQMVSLILNTILDGVRTLRHTEI